jgi:class 3 adenylate cyclase/tetratricopeptide (TPR) repeat protein
VQERSTLVAVVTCSSCGAENRPDAKFCGECGAAFAVTCDACGAANEPSRKFCYECGAPLGERPPAHLAAAPVAERRLVSVLFADLVGFTSLSESRDPEDVRELLSRYFETCRRLIRLYGGTVEKFIGDAVMAVWGTPVATEDDPERAVRAALDLVASIAALGDEIGEPALRARAGVLTGEAAVTIGATSEGMVAGDLVNTASRVQASAPPGAVYVGETTRRATDRAVVYEDAGNFELAGKTSLFPLWRALRVVSGARGALKAEGLEAPFVGRERELRLLKELFHTSAEEQRARLVSVMGVAGIGKSRLTWEFYKYLDAIAELTAFWHRGRCLAYGEGVTYWALADMVRFRCRIAEDEDAESATEKLRTVLAERVPDEEERRFVEPRLAHLLGLEQHVAREKQELFGAWRLFFERLADVQPVVMVFEDVQWADASLLEFVEYLLDWSRDHAVFVVTLARPELLERCPTWGSTARAFSSLPLEPLSEEAMEELLAGLVPGLDAELRREILLRAEGVPLYAVETVRMLLDRGLLVQEESVYRPVGMIDRLDVPESLHALIAARLDGLSSDERRVLQDGAVLGKTFTRGAVAALSGLDEARVEQLLGSLVRKEVLSIQADPRSPEHGQFGFLQDLVRHVAYEMLSRRERKVRHLAAAAQLGHSFATEQEVVEVLAAHYLAAYHALPDDADAGDVKQRAAELLARAGERAASLAAAGEAQRYFEQAAALTDDDLQRAQLLERGGQMAFRGGASEEALRLLEGAQELVGGRDPHAAARVAARLGEVEWRLGRLDDAVTRMERSFEQLRGEADADVARLAAELGRVYTFGGELARASERIEVTLELAESLWLPDVLADALITKGLIATRRSRTEEGFALTARGVALAREHDVSRAVVRGSNNLGDILSRSERWEDALAQLELGLLTARRVGDRFWEAFILGERSLALAFCGRWDEALDCVAQMPEDRFTGTTVSFLGVVVPLVARGLPEDARNLLARFAPLETAADVENRGTYHAALAVVLRAEGDDAGALTAAERACGVMSDLGAGSQAIKLALPEGLDAAVALGAPDRGTALLTPIEELPPGRLTPSLRAHAHRFHGRLAAADGDVANGTERLKAAASLFREFAMPFWLAVTLLDHAELVPPDEAAPLFGEASALFEGLGATPWLERAAAIRQPVAHT